LKLLTLARDLQRRRGRERQRLFVAEGVRTVEELLRSTLSVQGALVSPQLAGTARGSKLLELLRNRSIPIEEISAAELESAADTDTPQGVLVMAEVPRRSLEDLPESSPARLVILDGVQDPGNVGAVLRTAAALGAVATIALPGTVDLWNTKVVRSAMGAHFHHPSLTCTWDEASAFLSARAIGLWGADSAGTPLDSVAGDGKPVPERLALVLGNEGSGLSATARERADRLVALPIASTVDSLNVAVAAGIFLYQLRR
jgi:RNA methyltransferase, TrmH family